MTVADESTILANNIAKGIWYRRKDGAMYGASLAVDHYVAGAAKVRAVALDPNTLEETGAARIVPLESFYCFYCRRDRLEG